MEWQWSSTYAMNQAFCLYHWPFMWSWYTVTLVSFSSRNEKYVRLIGRFRHHSSSKCHWSSTESIWIQHCQSHTAMGAPFLLTLTLIACGMFKDRKEPRRSGVPVLLTTVLPPELGRGGSFQRRLSYGSRSVPDFLFALHHETGFLAVLLLL